MKTKLLCIILLLVIMGVVVLAVDDSCLDTDGGNEPTIKGNVSGYWNGKEYFEEDYCAGTTEAKLWEFYCSEDKMIAEDYFCEKEFGTEWECKDGACIECEDDSDCEEEETCKDNVCKTSWLRNWIVPIIIAVVVALVGVVLFFIFRKKKKKR